MLEGGKQVRNLGSKSFGIEKAVKEVPETV